MPIFISALAHAKILPKLARYWDWSFMPWEFEVDDGRD
jgi:hypothetical protein